MNKKDKRLYKKPKYKIGDIVVYTDRYYDKKKESLLRVFQEKIIEARALIEPGFKDDVLGWSYHTDRIIEEKEDCLYDNEILYKL